MITFGFISKRKEIDAEMINAEEEIQALSSNGFLSNPVNTNNSRRNPYTNDNQKQVEPTTTQYSGAGAGGGGAWGRTSEGAGGIG